MCKLVFGAFIFFLNLAFTSAYAQNRIKLSTYNDLWGGGNVPIRDDFRSFGLSLTGSWKQWTGIVDLSGLTYKTALDSNLRKRTDELHLELQYHIFTHSRFQFLAIGGVDIFGNMGGQWLQEQTHHIFGVPQVSLPYESYHCIPFVSSTIHLDTFQIKHFFSTAQAQAFIGASALASIQIHIGWHQPKQEIRLSLGWDYNQALYTSETWKKVCQQESGAFIGFRHQTNAFSFEWKTWLKGFSQGILSIYVPLEKSQLSPKNNIKMSFGTWLKSGGYYYQVGIPISGHLPQLYICATHQFGTLVSRHLSDFPHTLGHSRTFSIGLSYQPYQIPNKRIYISPIASGSMGMKEYSLYKPGYPPFLHQWNGALLASLGLECSIRIKLYQPTRIGFSFQGVYTYTETPKPIRSIPWLWGGGLFLQM